MAKSTLRSPLPVELFAEIINLLPLTDQRTLTFVSRLTRTLALESVFGQLQYTGKITPKIRDIHQARDDVKAVIKSVSFRTRVKKKPKPFLISDMALESSICIQTTCLFKRTMIAMSYSDSWKRFQT
jgi:hypothetical protein